MKNVGSRFTALILMLIFCAVLAVYRASWFDVSFVTRPSASESSDVEADDTKADTSSYVADVSEGDVSDVSTSGVDVTYVNDTTTEGSESEAPNEMTFISYSDARTEGYKLSYADWVTGTKWLLAAADVTVPEYYSSMTETVYSITYEISDDKTEVVPVYTEKTQAKPALKLYMGYILIETANKNKVNIYSFEGKLLGSYDPDQISPAWCRDKSDRPLFSYKDAYYYLDEKSKTFVEADYDPVRDGRGANFDYTADYGKTSGDMTYLESLETVFEYELIENEFDESGYPLAYKFTKDIYKFALAKKSGEALTEYNYFGKYAFSESLSAVIDGEGHLSYINSSATAVIKTRSTSRLDSSLDRYVYEYYVEPVTNGVESIGFYFFEHGLTRIRLHTIDQRYFDKYGTVFVVADEDFLIYKDGSRFPIPVGYDIVAYSDGMILLSKDGKYGYMSYTGEWIVDPTLTYAEPFYEGLAVVGKGTSYALIDTNGNEVLPFGQFSHITNASSGLIAVYGADGWQVLYKCVK